MSSHPDAANFFMMALSSSMFMPSFHSDFHRLFDLVPLGWSVRCHELQGSPLPLNQPDQVTRPPAEASGLPVPVVTEDVAVFVIRAGIQAPAFSRKSLSRPPSVKQDSFSGQDEA